MTGYRGSEWYRFLTKARTANPDECWAWAGSKVHGYGQFRVDGSTRLTHVWAYEQLVGPVPDGMDVGHVCHDLAMALGLCVGGDTCAHRACWNPRHLKAMTRSENLKGTIRPKKPTCRKGHPWTTENTGFQPGGRYCKTCKRENERVRKIPKVIR